MNFVYMVIIYLCADKINNVTAKKSFNVKACPQFFSKYTDSVDELLGDWHITLLIMDETEEEFEENSLCIQGKLLKINNSTLIQIWNVELPALLHQERSQIEFPTKIIQPGIWLVRSPLGGEFSGTIIDSDGKSYLLITYCGWKDGSPAHMMTLAMSRENVVVPKQKLHFLSLLIKNGYDPYKNKIISWSNC